MFSQKKKLVLFSTRELGRVSSTGVSTPYISSVWSVYTLYLVYSKCYELYYHLSDMSYEVVTMTVTVIYDITLFLLLLSSKIRQVYYLQFWQ